MYKHILICTDGSAVAQKGVDHGLPLAKALGARVTLITTTEPLPLEMTAGVVGWVPTQSTFDEFDLAQKEFAGKALAAAKKQADDLGVAADVVHVPNTRPAEAILQTAVARGCDLIVMASHGRRGVRKFLLGSQTQEVVTESPVPVHVVR